MTTREELLARFSEGPEIHVYQVEVPADAALLLSLPGDALKNAAFLDPRALSADAPGTWLRLGELAELSRTVKAPRPVHFLFHTGHVGSTLVSRLIGDAPGMLSLREPLPLHTLAGTADDLGTPSALLTETAHRELTKTLLRTWSRGHADTRAVVVKAPSIATRVAPRLLREAPEARAVHLSVTPERFIAGWLGRSALPVDLRAYGPERHRRLSSRLSAPVPPLASLSLGELAAMSWLSESLTARAVQQEFGERLLRVDFDAFLSAIGETATKILCHFGVEPEGDVARAAANSPWLSVHAKSPSAPFSSETRNELIERAKSRHPEELRKGLAFIDSLGRSDPTAADAL